MEPQGDFSTRLYLRSIDGGPAVSVVVARYAHARWPDDVIWAVQYGVALWAIGRGDEAEPVLLAAHPRRTRNRDRIEWTLGNIYRERGRFAEAEKWFRMATVTAPEKTGPWIYLGIFLANQFRLEEAKAALERGLSAEGDVDEVYLNLGYVHRRLGDLEGAKQSFRSALSLCPDYPKARDALRDVEEAIRVEIYLRSNGSPRAGG